MDTRDERLEGLILELRRGTLVLCVLSQLTAPQYGYSLVQMLEEKGMPVDPGTLYPLLRRLETQGLLRSEWETAGPKPRKYYGITEDGKLIYGSLLDEWRSMASGIAGMTGGQGEAGEPAR